jgi:hypothetical protein
LADETIHVWSSYTTNSQERGSKVDPLNSNYKELVISSDVLTPVEKMSQYTVNTIYVGTDDFLLQL